MNKYTYYYLNSTFSLDIENLSSIATRDWKSIYFKNYIFYLWPLYITAAPTNIITNEPSRLVEAKKAPNQRERRINFHSKIFPLFKNFCRIMLDMYFDVIWYIFSQNLDVVLLWCIDISDGKLGTYGPRGKFSYGVFPEGSKLACEFSALTYSIPEWPDH